MTKWLFDCSKQRRCALLQHGVGPASEDLFARFRRVAFFVLVPGAAAQQLSARLAAANLTHVYVLRADLQRKGSKPMNNDVLNPTRRGLRALEALRSSNEFFDLQIIHSSAPSWLLQPSQEDARHVIALAASTLLLLPTAAARAAWHRALDEKETITHGDGGSANRVVEQQQEQPQADKSAVAATCTLEASVVSDGCGDEDPTTCGRSGTDACLGGVSVHDPSAQSALLLQLHSLRRVNAHHFSCWQSERCHQRMYVMDLPRAVPASSKATLGWQRRVPRLYRVDDGTRIGPHKFHTVGEAWALRGKDLGFSTGGLNLDSAIGLLLTASARAHLAAQFLALPVGRDMMLWNIIVGREGLYAIDQEGHAYEDGAVPWAQRALPYCITVRDCYEKGLAALCGRQRPTQPLDECFTALTQADLCPQPGRPYPCPNGCQASFLECARRRKPPEAFVDRAS